LAIAQLGRYYGLPVYGAGGLSTSKLLDFQAIIEATASIFIAALSGTNMVQCIGDIDFALTGSLELITTMDEFVSMIRHILRGIKVNDDTLAVDLIGKVGPGGNYLAEKHTRNRFREEIWFPTLIDRWKREQWKVRGSKDFQQRAREKTMEILSTHTPEPLPNDVCDKLTRIAKEAEKSALSG